MNPPRPLFVHVHVPKCAGTSFNALIERSFGAAHMNAYSPDPYFVWEDAALAEHLAKRPKVLSVSSHSIRTYPERLGDRLPLYVCFLRDPIDWFLSNLTYVKANYAKLSPEHSALLPAGAQSMPLRELARWLLDQERAKASNYGSVTRFLSETAFRRALRPLMEIPASPAPMPAEAVALYESRAVAMTTRLLERFLVVGLVERMDDSIRLLRRKLAEHGLVLAESEIEEKNVSRQMRDDLSWLNEHDAVGLRVLHFLRHDLKLYEHAKQRLEMELNGPQSMRTGLSWGRRSEAAHFRVPPYTVTWAYEWARRRLEQSGVEGRELVDLGSGASNPLILWYAKRVKQAKLIDLKNPAQPLENTQTIVADLEKPLPLPDASADFVVSISVLEHLTAEGRLGVMREVQRILKRGGRAFITVSHLFDLTDHAIEVLHREPWLNERGNQISSRLDVAAMLAACPQLRLIGEANVGDFPGFEGFSESRVRENPDLLTMPIADSDWATFTPETNALKIQWAEVALALEKA